MHLRGWAAAGGAQYAPTDADTVFPAASVGQFSLVAQLLQSASSGRQAPFSPTRSSEMHTDSQPVESSA